MVNQESKSKTASTAKTAAKPKTASTAKTTAEPKTASTAKTAAEPKIASTAKTTAKPKTASTAKTTAEPKTASTAKTTAKPKTASTAKTTAEPKTASTAKTTAEPKTASTAKTTAEPKTASTAKTTAEPKTASTAKTTSQQKKEKSALTSKEKKSFIASFKTKKISLIIISLVAILLILALVLGIIFGMKSCDGSSKSPVDKLSSYDTEYKTTTQVGYSGEVIGKVDRVKPVEEILDGGLETGYPTYGKNMTSVLGDSEDKVAARQALCLEGSYLTASTTVGAGGGGYTWMDENGYLYAGTRAEPVELVDKDLGGKRRLYKHTSSVGLYCGDVDDDEPGIVKQVTLRNRGYNSYSVTGVYAPAGEVIKIQISEADMESTGGLTIHIGQALYNGQANNIWVQKNSMPRIPYLLNTMVVNKNTAILENGVYTAYIGSFIGGPIYIRNTSATFTATISGGVAYSHFILGYTTKEEFEQNAKSSAPYFDLEVWNFGVLHSGPKKWAESFTYDDIYKAGILWEKVSSVSTTGSNQGIVFLYDPFVAAGAAVAFPGRSSVNCPDSWMASSLNYNALITSGSWGNFHEYHHNFQGYGVPNGGEVTNNAMTLVSYAEFTKISSARGLGSYGAQGLSGWNGFTTATATMYQSLNATSANTSLSFYATLIHNFGGDNFIQAKIKQQTTYKGTTFVNYLKAWQDVTHNDMTYFFGDISHGITADEAKSLTNPNYSMFVPVASVFQTGRSYMYDGEKKYMTSMQPYVIQYGEEFKVDLNKYNAPDGQYKSGSIMLPDDCEYEIINVTQPEYGTFTATGEKNIYTYIPDKNHMQSGKILVTLRITNAKFKVDDVDLVLEFEQTHEKNKYVLERNTYLFNGDTVYDSATAAYDAGYAGYSQKFETDNLNSTQNSNTDVWLKPFDQSQVGNPHYYPGDNAIIEVRGKIYIDETTKYRIALRGRYNVALYLSIGKSDSFELAATYVHSDSNNKFPQTEGTYVDLELEAGTWVYFKEVMLCQKGNSFIGIGFGKFTPPLGTMDEDGNVVGSTEETVTVGYATAYRNDYEFPEKEFESDYLYKRKFHYNYNDNIHLEPSKPLEEGETPRPNTSVQKVLNVTGYNAWSASHPIENLVDGSIDSFIHTKRVADFAATPLEITVDLGQVFTANRVTLWHQNRGDPQIATAFTLYGSLDNETYFTIGEFSGFEVKAWQRKIIADFDKEETFRYYKLKITQSNAWGIILARVDFDRILEINGGDLYSPDDAMFNYGKNWWGASTQSTFGHVYVGKKKSSMTFEFEGNRVGILSTDAYGNDFEVLVDGKKVNSIVLKEDENYIKAVFLSEQFDNGKHTVTIKCLGEADIDSIILYSD